MRAVLKAQINKTDRNDARGMAQMMRVGLYRPVHVKTLRSQKLRMLLTHRKLLQSKAVAIDNDLRRRGRDREPPEATFEARADLEARRPVSETHSGGRSPCGVEAGAQAAGEVSVGHTASRPQTV